MAIDHDNIVRLLLADRDKLHAYIWAIVRDDHVAEDVFQDVSLLAINKRDEIDGESHFAAWVRAAARNKSLHALRQRGRGPAVLDGQLLDLIEGEWTKYDAARSSDMVDALRGCVEKLSPYARQLVDMRYADGTKPAAIAERLGRKVTTVYVALTRTHKSLAECIQRTLAGAAE
ncbi:MAG: sigma-70 family RNA polymerase sigma factor [Phycisphaera sp.]|nr:sigma-70 family RNA polymerase sigma factor [Phycisphaera sp.]